MPDTTTDMPVPTGTDIQISTEYDFSNTLIDYSGDYTTTKPFTAGELPYGVDLHLRFRHKSTVGETNWSDAVRFKIEAPAEVIGVALETVENSHGVFHWINLNGDEVTTFDYTKYPVFANTSTVVLDTERTSTGVIMTKIPKFYIKTMTSGPINTFAQGKQCWWISDKPLDGFRPASCFKRTNEKDDDGKYIISDYVYISTYAGSSDTIDNKTCLGSKPNVTPLTRYTKPEFLTYCTNRNNTEAGQTGYRMFDLHDLAALRLLFLIAHKSITSGDSTDMTQTSLIATGTNASGTLFFTSNHDNGPKIMDLWGSYWTHFRACSVGSGSIHFYSPMDAGLTELAVKSGTESKYAFPSFATPPGNVFGMTIYSGPITIGDDVHDTMEFFMFDSFTATSTQSVWNANVFLDSEETTFTWSFGGPELKNYVSLFSITDEISDDPKRLTADVYYLVARLAKS